MILNLNSGEKIVYPTDELDFISFDEVGDVNVSIEVTGCEKNSIALKAVRNNACSTFKMLVLPSAEASDIEAVIALLKESGMEYSEDFEGSIGGLTPQTNYTIAALAYDEYGFDCELTTVNTATASEVAESIAQGDGSEANPYIITELGELLLMQQQVNARDAQYVGAYYQLASDIDLEGREWTPIGLGDTNEEVLKAENNGFEGVFDGGDHTISGLNVVVGSTDVISTYAGLFGFVYGGTVKNLNVKGYSKAIAGTSAIAGGVVAYAIAGTVSGCSYEGSCQAGEIDGTAEQAIAGGVIGLIQQTSVDGCSVLIPADSKVLAYGASAGAGGIVGNGYSGMITTSIVSIAGEIEAKLPAGISSGTPAATAGALSGNNFGAVVSGADIEVLGKITADCNGCSGSSAAAGGASGSNSADTYGDVSVELSGVITAFADNKAHAAGGIGCVEGGYGVTGISVVSTAGSSISSAATTGGGYAGGVLGFTGTFQVGGSGSNLNADIAGGISAEGVEIADAGGVCGSGVLTNCFAMIRSTATITAKSSSYAISGGVAGQISGNSKILYSVVEGTLAVSQASRLSAMGGVVGAATGTRMARRTIDGSYGIVSGSFVNLDNATSQIGAFIGSSNAYVTLSNCYWYSSNEAITTMNGAGSTTGQLNGTTVEDFTEAITAMNGSVSDLGAYEYNSEKGYPVFVRTTTVE